MELTENNRQNVLLILIILSLVCLCSSFLLFVCAVNIKATIDKRISLLETYNSETIPGLFLFVGIVNMLENGSSAFISLRLRTVENRERMMKAMIPVLIGGLVLVILEVSSTIASFVHIGILDNEFGEGITKAMKEYAKGKELKHEIDFVQATYRCCGEMAYTDWFRHPWIDASNLVTTHTKYLQNDGLYYSDDAPYSCCDRRAPRPCIHHHVHDNDRHHNYDHKTETTLHHDGCRRTLSAVYSSILTNISVISLVAALLKVGILLLLRLIHTSLSMAQQEGDWEATTPAYIYFFREETEQGYEKLGDDSETENEDDGGETTDGAGETTTDAETENEDGGDDVGGNGGDRDDNDDGGGGVDADDNSDKDINENLGGHSGLSARSDTNNVIYSPPHNFVKKLRKKGRDVLHGTIAHVNVSPQSQISSFGEKRRAKKKSRGEQVCLFESEIGEEGSVKGCRSNHTMPGMLPTSAGLKVKGKMRHSTYDGENSHGEEECLFESEVGEGRSVKVCRSHHTMPETLPTSGGVKVKGKVRYTPYDGDVSYMSMSTGKNDLDSQTCTDHPTSGIYKENSNIMCWDEPRRVDRLIGGENMWDFMRADKRHGNLSYIDTLNTSLADGFINSGHNTKGRAHMPQRLSFQDATSKASTNFTDSYREQYCTGKDVTPANSFQQRIKERGTIPWIDEMSSSFINSFNDSMGCSTNAGHISRENVSEPLRLQNMKTKSTEIPWHKWQPLSTGEAGPDKDAVQFPGHGGDKLVNISSASNERVSRQKSIHGGNEASGYCGLKTNFTDQTFESEYDNRHKIPDMQKGKNRPNDSKRLFNNKPTITPDRLVPPNIMCQSTWSHTQTPNITRPEPILSTGRQLQAMALDNSRSEIISNMSRTSNTLSQPSSKHSLSQHTKQMSRTISSECDLIPTIQRRGHDVNTETSARTTCADFSREELSPEVAGINFPQTLSMNCSIDIDFPNRRPVATLDPPFPDQDNVWVNTNQKYLKVYQEGTTQMTGKDSHSPKYLNDTLTHNRSQTEPLESPSEIMTPVGKNPRQYPSDNRFSSTKCENNKLSFNQERKNHYRSSQRKNIFLASPLPSSSSPDMCSTDSKLYPQTSTPIEHISRLPSKCQPTHRVRIKCDEFLLQHDEMHTLQNPTTTHKFPENGQMANKVENKNTKEVNLIDLSEASVNEQGATETKGSLSETRSPTMISPFN